jgi:hypothetical protein
MSALVLLPVLPLFFLFITCLGSKILNVLYFCMQTKSDITGYDILVLVLVLGSNFSGFAFGTKLPTSS